MQFLVDMVRTGVLVELSVHGFCLTLGVTRSSLSSSSSVSGPSGVISEASDGHSLPMVREEARDGSTPAKWSPTPLMRWIWFWLSKSISGGGVEARETSIGLWRDPGSLLAEEAVLTAAEAELSAMERNDVDLASSSGCSFVLLDRVRIVRDLVIVESSIGANVNCCS
jgi:hypothetical protein